jgi:hypothetical protein
MAVWWKAAPDVIPAKAGIHLRRGFPGSLPSQRGLRPQPKMLAKKTRCCAFAVQG